MKTISKALVGTVAAGAMALASATPAVARDRDGDGISAGDIIAGALVIGGIAAVAGSIGRGGYNGGTYGGPYYGNDGYGYDSRYGYDNRYGYRGGNPRAAVEQCVNAARSDLARQGYRGARVTDIRNVDPRRDGVKVRGTVVVNERGGGWNRDYNYAYGGRNYDRGNFSCTVEYGRVVDLDYSGLKGNGRYDGYGYNDRRYGW